MRDVLLGLLPLLGVAIGALLQHFLSQRKDAEAHFSRLRHDVYASCLQAVASCASIPSPTSLASLVEAKARLAVYGSHQVILLMADFERAGAVFTNHVSTDAFIRLAVQMRAEAGIKASEGVPEALNTILFGHNTSS